MMKRYRHDPINFHGQYPDYYTVRLNPEPEDENGEWVKFTDHQAEIAKRDELLERCLEFIRDMDRIPTRLIDDVSEHLAQKGNT